MGDLENESSQIGSINSQEDIHSQRPSSRQRLKPPPRVVSDFFFEQRLYDFANKNLEAHVTEDMKKYMDESSDAKEKVGALLLAFEYFNAISEIKLEYDKNEFLNFKKDWIYQLRINLKWILFGGLLFFIFIVMLFNLEALINYFGPYFY